MAKITHRAAPASQNHVIQRWAVTNAAARLAIVPTPEDVGGVARQDDDGTTWVLRSVAPVVWRQIDPDPAEFAAPAYAAQLAAEAARDVAAAARDAAATAGATYVDTTAGLAAVADGAYFYVPTGDTLIRYRRVGAAAVEVGRLPSGAAVQAMQAALTPAATDTASDLLDFVDQNGAVFARFDANAELRLAGDSRTVQVAMSTTRQATDSNDDLFQVVDLNGQVTMRQDKNSALLLPGQAESVQSAMERARYGVTASSWTTLPGSFTPFTRAYSGLERYIWAGMPRCLRPNNTRWVGYPFSWPTVGTFVDPTMVRRRTATYAQPASLEVGTLDSLTVNLPVGYSGVYQFRDISIIYDRRLGKYWACLNSIGTYAGGFLTDRFAIFESTDGLTWDFTTYVIPGQVSAPTAKVWSPEWFIDDDGTVYVIVGLNTGVDANSYHLMRCTDAETMTAWAYHGKITGTTLPTNVGGGYAMNDPVLIKRDGVYYVLWSAMSSATSVAAYQLGLSYSTSLLGPYNQGHSFTDNTGTLIRGEGQSVVELPPGSKRRFRLFWFNVAGQTYNSRSAAVMQSPCVDSDDLVTFDDVITHGTDASYFQHNTAILGA